MAVDVIAPDARKKVDELFLYWLSEPTTQDILRQELARVCGLQQQKLDLLGPAYSHHRSRSTSPTVRDVTPPPAPSTSPSRVSPKAFPRNGLLENQTAVVCQNGVEDVERETGFALSSSLVGSKTEAEITTVQKDNGSQLAVNSYKPVCIPPFYFPKGQPQVHKDSRTLQKVEKVFQKTSHQEIPKKDFHLVIKALGLPYYWKAPLFKACCSGKNSKKITTVSFTTFKKVWSKITEQCHNESSRFMSILLYNKKRDYLIEEDFETLVQDVVDCHPGLEFLRDAPEFHTRYVETVISRIFYTVDRTWKGRITLCDIHNSNFLQTLARLETENDINKISDYFSYEHFYVIYCKFWELDSDHDLLISAEDLVRHNDHALNGFVIDRLVSGVVTRYKTTPTGQMSYKDFVWFLLSEEDKTTSRSIEYWFRVLDKDGDGVLSLYELEHFYCEVLKRLEEMNVESLSVENTVCQVLDMVNPKESGKISLRDLKRCRLTPQFLNTFINIEKYLDYEQKDPSPLKDEDEECLSDWERFAAYQYEILVAEEQCEEEEGEQDDDDTLCELEPMDTKDYLVVPRTV